MTTWKELYTSVKKLYKQLMLKNEWTTTQIDEMDVHFFFDMFEVEQEEEVYLSELW